MVTIVSDFLMYSHRRVCERVNKCKRSYLLVSSQPKHTGSGGSTINASISEMWAGAESTSALTTGISEMYRLLAWSSAKQNTLLSHHRGEAIKPSAICTQFRSWLNRTSSTSTGHSIPLEQFGRWEYSDRSTATLQTADAVQVSQPSAITANHLQLRWMRKKHSWKQRNEIHLAGYAISLLNVTLNKN